MTHIKNAAVLILLASFICGKCSTVQPLNEHCTELDGYLNVNPSSMIHAGIDYLL